MQPDRQGRVLPGLWRRNEPHVAANHITIREAVPREKIHHGRNGFVVDGSEYAVTQTLLSGAMGIVYRGERVRGIGPDSIIVKQFAYPIDEALVNSPETIDKFVSEWERRTPRMRDQKRKATGLLTYLEENIHDNKILANVLAHIKDASSLAGIVRGLKAFATDDAQAGPIREDLARRQAEFIREYLLLKFANEQGVDHIPAVYDAMVRMHTPSSVNGHDMYNYYYFQEESPGESVDSWYRKGGRLTEEEVIRVTLELAHTLDSLHQLGIVYRDISYNNVFIYKDNTDDNMHLALLIDFGAGIAIPFDNNHSPAYDVLLHDKELQRRHLNPNAFVGIGTKGFMPPEAGGAVNEKADTFSIGRLLFFLMTNQNPLEAPAAFAQQLGGTYMNPDLVHIIREATSENYHNRPYMDEFIEKLTAYEQTQRRRRRGVT